MVADGKRRMWFLNKRAMVYRFDSHRLLKKKTSGTFRRYACILVAAVLKYHLKATIPPKKHRQKSIFKKQYNDMLIQI
jgi:hypothetical protein